MFYYMVECFQQGFSAEGQKQAEADDMGECRP